MSNKTLFLIAAFAVICSAPASAQFAPLIFDPQQALNSDEFKTALGDDVSFYFVGVAPSSVKEQIGEIVLHRATVRRFGSREDTCRRVLLTLLRDFQGRAKDIGANAVINLQSVDIKDPAGDPTMIECLSGNQVQGRITLKGTFAQIEK